MIRNLYQTIFFALPGILVSYASHAQTSVSNVQLRVDPVVKKVIIEYALPDTRPNDSIYVELETASGRILRPISVQGDVGKGVEPGPKKQVAWDVVRDNIRLDETVTVLLRVAQGVKATNGMAVTAFGPESVKPKKSVIPIIGWVVAGGLTGYATLLALGLNKDADAYNSKPYADNATDLLNYQAQKSDIDARKGTFTIVAGTAAAVVVANVIYTVVRRKATGRTSLLIQSGNHLTRVGLSRRF